MKLLTLQAARRCGPGAGFNCYASTKAHPFQWSLCILFWSTGLWGLPVLSLSLKDISSTLYLTRESRLSPPRTHTQHFPQVNCVHFKGLLRCVAFWHLVCAYIYVRFKRRGRDWNITHILNISFINLKYLKRDVWFGKVIFITDELSLLSSLQ